MTPKPIVATAPLTEFGDVAESLEQIVSPNGVEYDKTYVPGFSDLRITRDQVVAEVKAGHRAVGDIPNLPMNLRWGRCATKEKTDNTKLFSHGNNGYRLVNEKEVGSEWLKALPGGSTVQPDGSIRNGDVVLMVADGKTAARNAARKMAETERRMTGAVTLFEQRLAGKAGPKGPDADDGSNDRQAPVAQNILKGAQPYIQKTGSK